MEAFHGLENKIVRNWEKKSEVEISKVELELNRHQMEAIGWESLEKKPS